MNETISTNLSVAGVGSKTICNGAHNQSYQRQGAVLIAIRVTHPLIKNNSVIVVAGLHLPLPTASLQTRKDTKGADGALDNTILCVLSPGSGRKGRKPRACYWHVLPPAQNCAVWLFYTLKTEPVFEFFDRLDCCWLKLVEFSLEWN